MSSISERDKNVKGSVPPSMLEAALAYARLGWHVLPLHGKIPLVDGGYKAATTDEETIRGWYGMYPRHNIGIATGAVSGVVVVDIDPRNGGKASLKKILPLLKSGGERISSPVVRTGGDGAHIYYATKVPFKSGGLPNHPGVDILGDKKYVVAPPSIHPDTNKAYYWKPGHSPKDVPLAEVPEGLVSMLNQREVAKTEGAVEHKGHPLDGFPEGSRHTGVRDYAWSLRQQSFKRFEVLSLVMTSAQKCTPPLDPDEAKGLVDSAFNKARDGIPEIEIITLRDLMSMELPEPSFIIDDVLAEGLTILSAPPKKGKSTLARNMALCVAKGELFAEHFKSQVGGVLYLSLEEGERPTQYYFNKMLGGAVPSQNLCLSFGWPVGKAASDAIEDWLQSGKVENPRLVVVDIFQRVRSEQKRSQGVYAFDTNSLIPFSEVAKRHPGVSILVLHHNNKGDASDHQDRISGSTGLTGVSDCNMTLERTGKQGFAILQASGRLVSEFKHVFVFCEETLSVSWRDPEVFLLHERRREVLEFLGQVCPDSLTVVEIQKELGPKGIRTLLSRMTKDGQIDRVGRGKYKLPQQNPNSSNEETMKQPS